ncbi:MAG: YkgJ family cysteine cluster protein [Haloferacaceae archaeon]
MESLEAELERARSLSVADLADAIESIGFECTRCGACCKGYVECGGDADADDAGGDPHTATVFPDEVRRLRAAATAADDPALADAYDWRDVARPMPYGLGDDAGAGNGADADGDRAGSDADGGGETFEWALATDDCGDCTFYDESGGEGRCAVHADRPLVCRTYPFSVALGGTNQPLGGVVAEAGPVRAHECEGLGREIGRGDAEDLARALKERAIRELEEAIAVRDAYAPADPGPGETVVHDSEGPKRPDGRPYRG